MSLKVGYIVFYVGFLGIFIFLTNSFGLSVLGITQEELGAISTPPSEPGLIESLTFLFSLAVFGILTFSFLLTISTSILLLSIIVIVPLTVGLFWALLELARGN